MRTLILLAVVVGCGSKKEVAGHYDISFGTVPHGAAIVIDGKTVGTVGAHPLKFDVPPGVYLGDGTHSVIARVESACGPRDVPLTPQFNRSAEEMGREMGSTYVQYAAPTLAVQRIRIDRTRATNAKFAVGPQAIDDRTTIVWPDCDAGRVVTVDGKQIGALPAKQPANSDLVIAAVPTCYQETLVNYSQQITLASDGNTRVFEPTQLVWVQPIDHFLEHAPSTIESSEKGTSRLEVLAVECPRRTARARSKRSR